MSMLQIQLLLVVVLIALNAAFAGSEIALISLREGQIARLQRRGSRGAALARLARNPNQFLATIQIGITLAGFLASATAAVSLAEPLVQPLAFLGAGARPAAIVSVTLALTFATLVVGELAPKRIAMQRPEGWALLAARPLAFLAGLARPAVWLLGRSTDLIVRLSGADPSLQRETVTEEELRDLLITRPGFTRTQRDIIEGAFQISARSVEQIAVPRAEVFSIEADTPAAEAAAALIGAGRSRAPVRRGDLDQVLGIVHLRDLVGADSTAGQLARSPVFLPERLGVLEALRELRRVRQHLAIVIDEHGGVSGVLTLEDILEEVIGEIYDESDVHAVETGPQREEDGSVRLTGSFPIHDLADLDIELPHGPYNTVAGLVLHRLGRLPSAGDQVTVDRWDIMVTDVDRQAIRRVRIRPSPAAGDG